MLIRLGIAFTAHQVKSMGVFIAGDSSLISTLWMYSKSHVLSPTSKLLEIRFPPILVMAPKSAGHSYSQSIHQMHLGAFSLCIVSLKSRVIPHGTKGIGPKFITRLAHAKSYNSSHIILLVTLSIFII